MIEKGYGHVGRPTNLERKNKKNKKIILILILSIFVVAFFSFVYLVFSGDKIELSSLLGNSATTSSTTSDFDIVVDGKKSTIISLKYKSKKRLAVPAKFANQKVEWSSQNSNLVKVDQNGLINVVGKTAGITYVYATLENGQRESLTVKVYPTGSYVKGIKDSSNSKYDYKIHVGLKRNVAMQSFAISGDYIYYSQKQSNYIGAYISKVSLKEISNITDMDVDYGANYAVLKDYGYAGNIDIETTNGKEYLWTQCGDNKHCRVPLSNIKFIGRKIGTEKRSDNKTTTKSQSPSDVIVYNGVNYVAVDSANKTIVTINSGSKSKHEFKVYDLDDYVASKGGKLPIPIYTFTNTIKNNKYSKRGIAVSGNYIYSYEGNKSTSANKGIYITVYKLDGTIVINRLKVSYPDNNAYWEPNGIKVYDGKLFIGMSRTDKKTKLVSQYVYSVGEDAIKHNAIVLDGGNFGENNVIVLDGGNFE